MTTLLIAEHDNSELKACHDVNVRTFNRKSLPPIFFYHII